MKKVAVFFLFLTVLISCSTKSEKSSPVNKNDSIKEIDRIQIPKISSDLLTPELLWSINRLGSFHLSPDKKNILYDITWFNIAENRSYCDLFTIPAEGGTPVRLTSTHEKESEEEWRPDGKKIGYLFTAPEGIQLWEMNPDGSGNKQITKVPGGISGFRYSPDLKHVLYVRSVKLDKDIHDLFPDLPLANARLETDLMYRHWDSWSDYTYQHVFVADYVNNEISNDKDIMRGERYDSPMKPDGGLEQIQWDPSGKTIAYSCKKKAGKEYTLSTNSDIYLYTVETGKTVNLTQGLMGYDKNPVYSPDGNWLAWESMARNGYESDRNRLFIADLKTGKRKNCSSDFDQNVQNLTWTADSKSLYLISDVEATDEIYRYDLNGGNFSRITMGIQDYTSLAICGNKLIASKMSMSQPAEVYSVDPATGLDQRLTSVTREIMDQLTMGKVESRWITTTDRKKMKVWVIYPPHFDPSKKYPALLYCQGGPQSTVSQFWSYRWNFQMMAANGYIVVAPNRRGLPGFGHKWNEQISGDYGGQNMKDYLIAIDTLAAEPYVDKKNLGAVGASYGGYSVYYLAGHHKKRFKTFIAHCGIFNMEALYSTTDEIWFANWDNGGPYWDLKNKTAQKTYKKFSPHRFVQNWDTPILVIHGEKDFRIPYTQGMGAFNSARLKGLPAEFLFFPDESHWVTQAQDGILWQRVFFQWLDKWLKR